MYRLAGIAQPRRDAVDGGGQDVVQLLALFPAPFAAQQLDLDQAQGVHVGVAQPEGAGQGRIVLQQARLAGDRQQHPPGALVLLDHHAEDPFPQRHIRDQVGVEAGEGQIDLGQGQLHVADQVVEEGERAASCPSAALHCSFPRAAKRSRA